MNEIRPLLFVHIPATGGSSISALLRWYGRRGLCTTQIDRHGRDFTNPIDATLTRIAHKRVCDFDENWVAERLVAAFVRNPWDRAVSQWAYERRQYLEGKPWLGVSRAQMIPKSAALDFHKYVLYITAEDLVPSSHNRPQVEWLRRGNAIVPAFIGRFETLNTDWEKLCRLVGLPKAKLVHYNHSEHSPYRECYNRADRIRIKNLFREDIEEFEYEF